MAQVARELEQMYGVHIVIGDSVIAYRTVSGTFTDRTVEQVVGVVCTVASARCETRPDRVVIASQ